MKEKFEELYNALKLDREKSEWSNSISLKERAEHLKSESEEVLEAIEKNDVKNLHEELGDVLWDLLGVVIIAEEQNGFDIKEVINNALVKLKRRKSWIFEGKRLTLEEEKALWPKIKEKEKNIL
ncbi:hypothetical protein COV17_02605 [Candidatus Woesearchaeota archaeon CG10_big_fil_rev_8_21_14_0_10_36_11]|nr:MAG: hypothetical protein COV17_02605 [Candidatus Woesearchaeota archaeon CG10_big_fil_rev_8_21_14_0_10_36_11]